MIYKWMHSRRQRAFQASIPVQLKQGISIDRLLHTAIYRNFPEAVKELLDLGANVDAIAGEDETPLMAALGDQGIASSHIVEMLLEHGADVNVTNDGGQTALMLAYNDPGTVRLLLRHGARVDAEDDNGTTALEMAERFGDRDV